MTSSESPTERARSLVVIGNFDGVHRGHQCVLSAALARAAETRLEPLVLTFDPHPSEVLGRGARPVLTSLERKVSLLRRLGAALQVVVEPFTVELSRLSPEEFVSQILVDRLLARVVIVGENFRFGRDREGDPKLMATLGARFGFQLLAEALVGDEEGLFSSTRAREAIEAGDLVRVERCLGRPHSFSGTVVKGDGRAKALGFATANLADIREILPPHGVYACLVDEVDEQGGGRALARGISNLGVRPTVSAGFSVEVHLLDFDADLYGKRLRVHLIDRVRDEMRFSGLEALKNQVRADIQGARLSLETRAPDPAHGGAWA